MAVCWAAWVWGQALAAASGQVLALLELVQVLVQPGVLVVSSVA
ncbi:hypothetical protein [Pseudomonas fragi]|nr:hypothetical protein [Pseudomonas fragi]